MRVDADDSMPLYMSSILDQLRKFQKEGRKPGFLQFEKFITKELGLSDKQSSPLALRLQLLRSFISDSPENARFKTPDLFEDHGFVIVDLTDPMMSPSEGMIFLISKCNISSGAFQVSLHYSSSREVGCIRRGT